jgi:hypothetical protein
MTATGCFTNARTPDLQIPYRSTRAAEAARGWRSLIRRRERKELRPWSFISALWTGDDGVVVIVHRHRYVWLPTLRTAASDGYDHIFSHIILQARNAPSDHLTTSARGQGATNKNFGIAANWGSDYYGGARSSPKHLFSRNLIVRRYLTSCPTNCLCTPASALCPLFPIGHDSVVVGDQNVARSHTGWQESVRRTTHGTRSFGNAARVLAIIPRPRIVMLRGVTPSWSI